MLENPQNFNGHTLCFHSTYNIQQSICDVFEGIHNQTEPSSVNSVHFLRTATFSIEIFDLLEALNYANLVCENVCCHRFDSLTPPLLQYRAQYSSNHFIYHLRLSTTQKPKNRTKKKSKLFKTKNVIVFIVYGEEKKQKERRNLINVPNKLIKYEYIYLNQNKKE